MAEIQTSTWSETAASNTATPPDGSPEGMSRASVNNVMREDHAVLKREWNRSHPTVTNGGSSTVLTLTYTTAPTAYAQGLMFAFKALGAVGATPTINVNTLGAKKIYKNVAGTATQVAANDWYTGQVVVLAYDTALDAAAGGFNWVNQTLQTANIAAASETVSGVAELATQAEADAGSDDARIMTALKIKTLAASFFTGAQTAIATDTTRGTVEFAVQSELETPSSNVLTVPPGRLHFHPSHPKVALGLSTSGGTPTANAAYNVSSITDNGVGDFTVNFTTAFSAATYCVLFGAEEVISNEGSISMVDVGGRATGSVRINVLKWDQSAKVDPVMIGMAILGDQ